MSLSILIPTAGRLSLSRTLGSLVPQLMIGDEVIAIGDGARPSAADICRRTGVRYVDGPETHCFGNTQRQFGMTLATGTHLLFIDDDDVYVPGALDVVREDLTRWPDCPMLFRFIDKHGAVLWSDPAVREANVSTQQIVFPNRAEWLGTWKEVYEGDYWFIRSTLDKWPGGDGAVVWRPNVLADCRPALMTMREAVNA